MSTADAGWEAFLGLPEAAPEPDGVLRLRDGPERLSLVEVVPLRAGGFQVLAVAWEHDGRRLVGHRVGLLDLDDLSAATLRHLLEDWPPQAHDLVYRATGAPRWRPCFGSHLARLQDLDDCWFSAVQADLERVRAAHVRR